MLFAFVLYLRSSILGAAIKGGRDLDFRDPKGLEYVSLVKHTKEEVPALDFHPVCFHKFRQHRLTSWDPGLHKKEKVSWAL